MLKQYSRCFRMFGWRGLARAVNAHLRNSPDVLSHHRSDLPHPIFIRTLSSDVSTYNQVFQKREYKFDSQLDPGVIVDAGANIGLASVYFATKYPNARVFAIEPQRSNFELLRRNVEAYRNIVPVQAALWHENGMIDVLDPGRGHWGFVTSAAGGNNSGDASVCHSVDAWTIDRLMDKFGLQNIDILKVDIEGAEKEVFSDPSAWISSVKMLIVELHDRMKPGCNDSFYSGAKGFTTTWQHGENVYMVR